MTAFRRQAILTVACICLVWSSVGAEEPKSPKRDIRFETSEAPFPVSVDAPEDELNPTHVAVISLRAGRHLGNLMAYQPLLETPAGKSMSDKQKLFLRRRMFLRQRSLRGASRDLREYELHAVSEEDARKMVEAVIQRLDTAARESEEKAKKELAEYRKTLTEGEAGLPKLELKSGELRERARELEKSLGFSGSKNTERVRGEMNEQLRRIRIDRAGYQAKLKAIEVVKAWGKLDANLLAKIEELRILQTIEMAGTAAREIEAQAIRNQADVYVKLYDQASSAGNDVRRMKSRIDRAKKEIPNYEARVADPPADWRPVELAGNKAVIGKTRLVSRESSRGYRPLPGKTRLPTRK